jgi:glyoxylase-like metal-dependent hydrolase (beta-lactamase superfamily II)
MQIVKNLWQVGGPDLTSEEDAAVFLVRFGAAAALIDSGCGDAHRRLIDNVSAVLPADSEIELLLLTHCHYDHVGGAGGLREHYGCRIVAHELDAAYLEAGDSEVTAASWYGARLRPLPIDRKLARAHETLVLGDGEIEAYHCPGHSPGSVVYTATIDSRRVLFGQDVHGPLHPSLRSNAADYRRSLEFMLSLKADILCEGHFGVFHGTGEVEKFIRRYL